MDPSFNQDGPQFTWPQTTEQNQTEVQTNQILTNIRNVVTAFMNNQTGIPAPTTSSDFQTSSEHFLSTEVPNVTEKVFTSNPFESDSTIIISDMAQIITQLPETTISPSNEIVKNSTGVDLTVDPLISEMTGSNSTTITEMVQSDATAITDAITTQLAETASNPNLSEMFNSNNTMDPVITEMIGSNSTTLTEMIASNSTTLTEMIASNSTTFTEMAQGNSTMESAGGSILTQLGQNSTFVSTTENASVSEVVTKAVTHATEAVTGVLDHSASPESDLSMIEDKTLYIVVGTILIFLIILLVVLLVIYKRYKANGWVRSRSYHVANFSGVSVDSQKTNNLSY